MRVSTNLFIIIILFFYMSAPALPSPVPTTDNSSYSEKTTQHAVELTKRLVTSDKDDKNKILDEFKILVAKNPKNQIIRDMYVNNLIAEKHYQEGLNNLVIINNTHLTRTHLLTQCMLKERLGNKDEKCYKQVIELSEKTNTVDSDYITAIFFSDGKRFEALKSKLIKDKKFKESDFLVFSQGKENMLREFYP